MVATFKPAPTEAAVPTWKTRAVALLRDVAPCRIVFVIPKPVIVRDLLVRTIPHSVQRFVFRTMVSPLETLALATARERVEKVFVPPGPVGTYQVFVAAVTDATPSTKAKAIKNKRKQLLNLLIIKSSLAAEVIHSPNLTFER